MIAADMEIKTAMEHVNTSFNKNFETLSLMVTNLCTDNLTLKETVKQLQKVTDELQYKLHREVEVSDQRYAALNDMTQKYDTSVGDTKELQRKIDEFQAKNIDLTRELKIVTEQKGALEVQVEKLRHNITMMEEDQRQFTKVSHIIALEKENNKLRGEMEKMQHSLQQKIIEPKSTIAIEVAAVAADEVVAVDVPSAITEVNQEEKAVLTGDEVVDVPSEVTVAVAEVEKSSDQDEEEDYDVYEKDIKGKTYYVSNKEDKIIYDIEGDGSVGKAVGRIEKVNGRSKVVWTS
jgi:chromosome segregation ATPase